MLDVDLYMACLNLSRRRAVVVGRGGMADEKVEGLRSCGADVTVVDPDDYNTDVLEGCLLVVATTDDSALSRQIFADAEARSMLVNVADVPALCNFILPAIARIPPLTVAISTAGASPALAKRMKREVQELFGSHYARLAELLDEIRGWTKQHLTTYEERRDFFEAIVNGDPDPIELLAAGDEEAVRELIAKAQVRRQPRSGEEAPS